MVRIVDSVALPVEYIALLALVMSAPLFSGPDGYCVPTNWGMITVPVCWTTSRTVESVEMRAVLWRRAATVYAFLTLMYKAVRI